MNAPAQPTFQMKPYSQMAFHTDAENLVRILCERTQNSDPLFFRVLVAYYFCQVASMMRASITSKLIDEIPINMYAINLSVSGAGKGKSTNLMEDYVIDQFRHNFMESTFHLMAEENLPKLSLQRAARKGSDPDQELVLVQGEFDSLGPILFNFDSATGPAIKDIRHKMLMANAGSLNMQIDEIGINLTAVAEAMGPYLELYDVGKIKQKLTKNTSDNKRREEINGRTPANLLAFGTPTRLLDGGKTEEEFMTLLDTGYARRCFYGYSRSHQKKLELTPEEIYAQRVTGNTDQFLEDFSDHLGDLADMSQAHRKIEIPKDVELIFIAYEQEGIRRANTLGEHDELRKAEYLHRHFKTMKLAGAYAFIDGSPEVTEDHAYAAIALAEESGKAFNEMLIRDRPHVKLAKYIAEIGTPVTQADLVVDLPFYKGSIQAKNEMMQLAIAYGYKNSIIIKKAFSDGVEFISGETLKKTDLSRLLVSYSTDMAKDYQTDYAAFEDLYKMTQADGIHWCSHAFVNGHRTEDNAIPGFDLLVLDVEHSVNLSTAQLLLADYKALFYTTRRHQQIDQDGTQHGDRFRVILPMNYRLELDAKDHREFWRNVYDWLPFEVDHASSQRARKWLSHDGEYYYQDGDVLDILPFIPKTSKNEEFRSRVLDQQGMDNLERWVINNTGDGNRNNMLLRFAMILVDGGFDFDAIRQRVSELNNKLPDKLDEAEILGTIMVTVGKALAKR